MSETQQINDENGRKINFVRPDEQIEVIPISSEKIKSFHGDLFHQELSIEPTPCKLCQFRDGCDTTPNSPDCVLEAQENPLDVD